MAEQYENVINIYRPLFLVESIVFDLRGGENVTFSVKKITGSHTRRNFEDNDLIFFLNSQN